MEEFARVIVGLLFAALVVALVKEGPAGPAHWLRAKFLGRA